MYRFYLPYLKYFQTVYLFKLIEDADYDQLQNIIWKLNLELFFKRIGLNGKMISPLQCAFQGENYNVCDVVLKRIGQNTKLIECFIQQYKEGDQSLTTDRLSQKILSLEQYLMTKNQIYKTYLIQAAFRQHSSFDKNTDINVLMWIAMMMDNKAYTTKIISDNLDKKSHAFKRIYKALRDGQSGIYKTNFLEGKDHLSSAELMHAVAEYSKVNPASRTTEALRLTEMYYTDLANNALFTQIYNWSFEQSGWFKQSNISGVSFYTSTSLFSIQGDASYTSQQINQSILVKDSRSAKIHYALRR